MDGGVDATPPDNGMKQTTHMTGVTSCRQLAEGVG